MFWNSSSGPECCGPLSGLTGSGFCCPSSVSLSVEWGQQCACALQRLVAGMCTQPCKAPVTLTPGLAGCPQSRRGYIVDPASPDLALWPALPSWAPWDSYPQPSVGWEGMGSEDCCSWHSSA